MQISEASIRRPVMTTMLTATIIALGVFGFRLLSVSALPKVDFPTISVTATLPGASPDTMAASVAGIIERQLSTISGISSMSSISSQGSTNITIQFDLNRNIDAAALDVQTALTIAQRRLPIEMTTPPSFRKVNPSDFPVLFIALDSPSMGLAELNDYAENLIAPTLSTVDGVAQVNVYGQKRFAVRIRANTEMLTARGITLETRRTSEDSFNEIGFHDPDGQSVIVLEARTYSPVTRGADEISLCGYFTELSMPSADFEVAREFWEPLGFVATEEPDAPYAHMPLTSDHLDIAFHRPRTLDRRQRLPDRPRDLPPVPDRER